MTAAKGQVSRFVTKGSKRRRSTTATLGSLQQLGAPSTSTNSYQNAGQRLIRAGETGLIQAMCAVWPLLCISLALLIGGGQLLLHQCTVLSAPVSKDIQPAWKQHQ